MHSPKIVLEGGSILVKLVGLSLKMNHPYRLPKRYHDPPQVMKPGAYPGIARGGGGGDPVRNTQFMYRYQPNFLKVNIDCDKHYYVRFNVIYMMRTRINIIVLPTNNKNCCRYIRSSHCFDQFCNDHNRPREWLLDFGVSFLSNNLFRVFMITSGVTGIGHFIRSMGTSVFIIFRQRLKETPETLIWMNYKCFSLHSKD